MNVCGICMADGVLEVDGCWYCYKHLDSALQQCAGQVLALATPKLGWDSEEMEQAINELLEEAGFQWPDDDDEDE